MAAGSRDRRRCHRRVGSLAAEDGERGNFHRSARSPPAARGHAGPINRRYDTAGHSLNSRLCPVPADRRHPQPAIRPPKRMR
jgi:hypothetical protein